MQVDALDHVNILTDKMEDSAVFYSELLGLERRDAPPPMTPQQAQWLCDVEGRPIIHINAADCPRVFDRVVEPGASTGPVHHIALRLHGFEEVKARLEQRGLDFKEYYIHAIGLRQIFITDPNNVLLELNFFAG